MREAGNVTFEVDTREAKHGPSRISALIFSVADVLSSTHSFIHPSIQHIESPCVHLGAL